MTTATRSPELPSVAEFLPGYVSDFWTAMHAPEGLARIIAREQAIRTKVVRQAGIRVDP